MTLLQCAACSLPPRVPALRLRGGANAMELPPHFAHSVVLGLLANSAAVVLAHNLHGALEAAGLSSPRRLALAVVHAATVFVSFFAVFLLTGFVPMGYVPGATPWLPLFRLPS
ncbi:hypothetical protein AB1Y20_006303 [Prymnesium parvum]|uniref:Uncharacterized protein n=1 Tax=Prymnesium parvum TaxID=97485 RepID=A0AB34J4Q9_PRYPA